MAVNKISGNLRTELAALVGYLHELQSTVAVAVSALREQNADIDADVARLLQRAVGGRLQDHIDKLEALLHPASPRPTPSPRRKR